MNVTMQCSGCGKVISADLKKDVSITLGLKPVAAMKCEYCSTVTDIYITTLTRGKPE